MGEFELIEEIGHGGMGVVYRAHQAGLERDVAVKILPKVRTGDEQALERFRREAKAASNLNHPNVVPILSVGESHGMAWYAMALIEGQDLGAFLHDLKSGSAKAESVFGKFGTDEYFRKLAAAFAQVCDAVHYAHQSGVIHRDIKPANILLDQGGKLLLTDFGLAKDKRFGSISISGQLQGTPHYMSPEQARASVNQIDHRTDIYSLCVVLYELLSLKRPFGGGSALEVLEQIVAGVSSSLHSSEVKIPKPLAVLVEKGMSTKVGQRFAQSGDLSSDLRRISRGEAILTSAPGIGARVVSALGKRKKQLSIATVLLLVIAPWLLWESLKSFRSKVDVTLLSHDSIEQVRVYNLNAINGELSGMREVESTFRVPIGDYRIVAFGKDGYADLTRYFRDPGESVEIRIFLRPQAEVINGMLEVRNSKAANVGRASFQQYPWYEQFSFVPGSLWVDEFEVTNRQYLDYLKRTGSSEQVQAKFQATGHRLV